MTAFSSIDIARTGAGFASTWMDNISHNIANANTVRGPDEDPFRARLTEAGADLDGPYSAHGSGVYVRNVSDQGGEAAQVYAPDHPQADEDGNITRAVVDMEGQMTDMIIAQRSYQANLQAISSAREAYSSALSIGRGA